MFLAELPGIFTWSSESDVLTTLHGSFLDLLATRLGEQLARAMARGASQHVSAVTAALDALPPEVVDAILCAPEVSYRLLWPSHHDDVDAARFVAGVFTDAGRPDDRLPSAYPLQGSAGPDVFGADGAVVAHWPLYRELPLDVASTFALTVDVVGSRLRRDTPGPPLTPAELQATLLLLEEACVEIARGVGPAWRVVRDFTKVVMLLPDEAAPTQFSSGSSGQFVGRTVLSNPHLPTVTPVHLAEALVHEAMHSVLYMDEQHDDWVLDPALYAGPMRIASPWTGNPLPLRPFLQACFVWYGLLSFWSTALGRCRFDRECVRERIAVAASGFLRGDLLAHVREVKDRLAPPLIGAVAEMQSRVCAAVDEAAPSAAPR